MTFREAFTKACDARPRVAAKFYREWQELALDGKDRRLFWSLAERLVARRYRRATGHVGKIDWAQVINWLMEYLPGLIQLLIAILILL